MQKLNLSRRTLQRQLHELKELSFLKQVGKAQK
ncbi:MAG: hypothetical protein JW855_02325 [Gammaproteobacteria bacterium]|nr:hypothetical protein [Gammaproteobacteria bacterium]